MTLTIGKQLTGNLAWRYQRRFMRSPLLVLTVEVTEPVFSTDDGSYVADRTYWRDATEPDMMTLGKFGWIAKIGVVGYIEDH
jgi:hypothetical protein